MEGSLIASFVTVAPENISGGRRNYWL